MADAMSVTMTPEERANSAAWAKARLQQLKSTRRGAARTEYASALNADTAAGRDAYQRNVGTPMQSGINRQLNRLPSSVRSVVQPFADQYLQAQENLNDRRLRVGAATQALMANGELAQTAAARSARAATLRGLRKAARGEASPTEAENEALASIQPLAEQAWARLWDILQSTLAALGTAFWGVLSTVTLVPVVAVFFARLLGRMSFRIGFRGAKVHFVSPYSGAGMMTHVVSLLMNVGWAIIWLSVMIFLVYLYIEAQDKVCWASWVVNFFRAGFCPSSS